MSDEKCPKCEAMLKMYIALSGGKLYACGSIFSPHQSSRSEVCYEREIARLRKREKELLERITTMEDDPHFFDTQFDHE